MLGHIIIATSYSTLGAFAPDARSGSELASVGLAASSPRPSYVGFALA